MKKFLAISVLMVVLVACSNQNNSSSRPEDREAKAMLQGVWVDEESGDVTFRVSGDSIYFSDATSLPAYFRICGDSIYLGAGAAYGIVKQTPHLFWFNNQNGDLLKLQKSDESEIEAKTEPAAPTVITYTHQVKIDSVVFFNGNRYHWYVAVNPTKYRVTKRAFNDDGLEVENVYYDNIMNISIFQGAKKMYSSDFRKQQYKGFVPDTFLDEAILANMEFSHIDASGLHFNATLCIPDGATCYIVDSTISYTGKVSMKLVEY
ncbi:MAG: DUF4738 domain-containing protein [Prevotella sp.]|nr:DUF4738 domain-containing protein [Prevotella sp.]MBR1557252.1 DUF4738 domain-containing protein [Prevotella sp.]